MRNLNLNRAKLVKNDEFYTQYSDIEKEINHYVGYNPDVFKGKTVICPCDDYEWSNFSKYFKDNFKEFGLSTLVSTCYNANGRGKIQVITRDNSEEGYFVIKQGLLDGNGDMNGVEVWEYIEEVDFVITNPPFSLLREWLLELHNKDKNYLILGNQNVTTYKEIFPLIKDGLINIGVSCGGMNFTTNNEEIKKLGNICWFTNMNNGNVNKGLVLTKKFDSAYYKTFDNYDAINVDKLADIPLNYSGYMGVPITYLNKHHLEQFKILWMANGNTKINCPKSILTKIGYIPHKQDKGGVGVVEGKTVYTRVIIQRI